MKIFSLGQGCNPRALGVNGNVGQVSSLVSFQGGADVLKLSNSVDAKTMKQLFDFAKKAKIAYHKAIVAGNNENEKLFETEIKKSLKYLDKAIALNPEGVHIRRITPDGEKYDTQLIYLQKWHISLIHDVDGEPVGLKKIIDLNPRSEISKKLRAQIKSFTEVVNLLKD